MSFSLNVTITNYEFRGLRTGEGQNGVWMSLVLENPEDARQLDVSVPRDMHGEIYSKNLQKGDILTLNVRAYAGPEYSRVSLLDIISITDKEGEVI